jgi:2-keto-4-pentenoate hydratase
MDAAHRDRAATWIAESWRGGEPVPPMPYETLPRSQLDGQRIAARALEMLDLAPNGLRLATANDRPVPGPMLEAAVAEDEAVIALAGLRHPQAFAAIVGFLAEDLPRRGDEMPVFASLHPALDVTSWRLAEVPTTSALAAADLAGLGRVVVGRGKKLEPMRLRISVAPEGSWKRGIEIDIEEPILTAALAARRAGGLEKGSLLVAQLGSGVAVVAGTTLIASFGRLGRVKASFV